MYMLFRAWKETLILTVCTFPWALTNLPSQLSLHEHTHAPYKAVGLYSFFTQRSGDCTDPEIQGTPESLSVQLGGS